MKQKTKDFLKKFLSIFVAVILIGGMVIPIILTFLNL